MQTTLINRMAVGDIPRRAAAAQPDKTAFIEGDRRMTFGEFDARCNRFAHYLLGSGLHKGDAVACLCANSLDFIIAAFGIAKAGLVWVPMNVLLAREQIDYILGMVQARLILADTDLIPVLQSPAPVDPPHLALGGKGASAAGFEQALARQPAHDPEVDIEDRDPAMVMFTSGTTARPKGVVIAHANIYLATLNNIIELEMQRDDVTVAILPFFHCAQHTLVSSFLHRGATSVIVAGFEPEAIMEIITRHRVTWCFALPAMWRAILDHPERRRYSFASMRYGLYAMTPMDRETLTRLMDEVCPRFALSSGQTEVYPSACVFRPEDQFSKRGQYWGQPGLITEFQIMDEDGRLLAPGQTGELVVRGPTVMMAYIHDPEATAAARAHGWHHTGDIGRIDEDGRFLFEDRKKDMIKSGGENVASPAVEAALLGHPDVAAAAAVGLPHDHWIEAVTAFVQPRAGASVSEAQIIAWCRERLGKHEVPKAVLLVDGFPMTATGKILKHVLRRDYADHFGSGLDASCGVAGPDRNQTPEAT